jgi:hypothetical protein
MKVASKSLWVLALIPLLALSCNPAPTLQTKQQGVVQVTQTVAGQKQNETLQFSTTAPKTALDLLRSSYQVQTKDFGPGLGEFVEAIGNVKPASNEFWAFYVNGQFSNIGASSYTPQDGDKLEWRLETINSRSNE